jgi:uncharacterized protein YajQ (UPF0234 family)
MAQDFSFDVTCGYDKQEFANAIDQARREIMTRYDFKGVKAEIEVAETDMTIHTESEYKLQAVIDLIESKLVRRNVPLSILDKSKAVEQAAGGTVRQKLGLVASLSSEQAKDIAKTLRSEFPKIKPNVQGDAVRVVSKSKDELQAAMQHLKTKYNNLPLQFGNYH